VVSVLRYYWKLNAGYLLMLANFPFFENSCTVSQKL
jgi:hypothetical protein